MNEQKRKTRRILVNVILVILIFIIIFLAYKAYGILLEYHKAAREYKELQQTAITEKKAEDDEPPVEVDFEALRKINMDKN